MRMYNFKAKNNLKRRALAFGLAIATLLGLTACGQKAPVEKATEPSSAIESSKETQPQTPESSGDGKPTENSTANQPVAGGGTANGSSGEPNSGSGQPTAESQQPSADKPSADNDPPPERQEAGSDKEEDEGNTASGSTESSDSRQPSNEVPSSEKPSTSKPSTGNSKPSTEKPSSSKPSTPSTEAPSAGKPSTDKPSVEQPSSETPSTEKPSTEKPSTQKPSTEKPSSGLIGEIGEDPDGFTTDEELMKTCNGLHDYGPRNHAIVGQNEYINGTACYKRYEKEWETCVNCGVKNLISDGYHYYHQYTNKAWNDVYIVEGEMGCGKTCTVTSGTRCDCGMLDSVHTYTTTGEHTYQKQIDWDTIDVRPNPDGSRELYHYWRDQCLSCGDVRDEGWEFECHLEAE